MRVYSLVRSHISLAPLEVELTLVPGLPQIQILGLPDAAIRESAARIKSALRAQQFKFPKSQQVLVNLKPSHLKKTSRGLDLAIAAALLFETRQVRVPEKLETYFFYGELSLVGEIGAPDDMGDFVAEKEAATMVTGRGSSMEMPTIEISSLRDLQRPLPAPQTHLKSRPRRPPLAPLHFSTQAARLMMVVAAGEHSALLAGPPGSGKSTWAQHLHEVLAEPEWHQFRLSRQIARYFHTELTWRPTVAPHHSTTALAMIGGGVPISPGQITRAHGGVLILDELSEFSRVVHEALREPLETGRISVVRSGGSCDFPADILLVGTTNLCSCGKFIPKPSSDCLCPQRRREEYVRRLSGPLLDRFQLLVWTDDWGLSTLNQGGVTLAEIGERAQRARAFAQASRGQMSCNGKLGNEFMQTLEPFVLNHLLPQGAVSRRRLLACARVARTLADLEMSSQMKPKHWQRALEWTVQTFAALQS
jgi:magnesium chelatase family protein